MTQTIELSHKQAEYIRNANHRWNIKIGATQCGKTYIDTQYLIPNRIIERLGKSGLIFIVGVSKGTIQRNIIEPLQEIYLQHYTLFDNPFLPQKYVEELCKEYQGTVYYNRYILGQWCNAEGLIFQQIANSYKKYLTKEIQLNSIISIGIDWGGNKSKHSITATKISRNFKSVQCLKSDTMKATGTNTKQVFRWIINFMQDLIVNANKHRKNVDEFVSGISKAILLYGRILFKEPVTEDCIVKITNKDGFMVDTETAKQEFRQDIAQGIRQAWEYRVKFLGEDEETAKARVKDEEIEDVEE